MDNSSADKIVNSFDKLYKKLLKIILILIAAAAVLLAIAFSPLAVRPPELISKANVTVTETAVEERVGHDSDGNEEVSTYYTVDFKGTYEDGTKFVAQQTCTKKLYEKYSSMKGTETDAFVYNREDGRLFVSLLAQDQVYKEYRFVHMGGLQLVLVVICCFIPFVLFGLIAVALWARKLSKSRNAIAEALESSGQDG